MAILARRKRDWETLPDGRSVYGAVRDLSRPLETSSFQEPKPAPVRRVALPEPAPAGELPAFDSEPQRDFTLRGRTLADMPPPPTMIQRNNKGRPVAIIGGDDPIQKNLELIRAQEGYKAPRSTKDQILALLQGGVSGAIDYATNQKTRNRWAVGEDIANEEGQIARELGLRKSQNDLNRAGLQDDLLRSQIGENEAQAQRALREPLTREPGFTLGQGQVRYGPDGKVIATRPGKPTVEKPPERQVIDGKLLERQSDGLWKPVYESSAKPDTSGFTNDQIQQNIRDAEGEKAKIEQRLAEIPITINGVDEYGQPAIKPNPEYVEHKNRRDKLIDDIRKFRADLKAPTSRGQNRVVKPARDGKYHYTQAQIRTAAESSGKSYDEVLRQLKARPNVVIDQ